MVHQRQRLISLFTAASHDTSMYDEEFGYFSWGSGNVSRRAHFICYLAFLGRQLVRSMTQQKSFLRLQTKERNLSYILPRLGHSCSISFINPCGCSGLHPRSAEPMFECSAHPIDPVPLSCP